MLKFKGQNVGINNGVAKFEKHKKFIENISNI